MPCHRRPISQGTKRVACLVATLFTLNCTGGAGSAILPDSKKDENTGESDDSADKSAPVSGAYLTCYVPKPKDTEDKMFGGCQVRDKSGKHVDMSKARQKFTFVRPTGAKDNLAIAVFDISKKKTRSYFDVIYRINLPKAGASLQGSTAPTRTQAGNYFLNVVPVMMPSTTLLSATKSKLSTKPSTPTRRTVTGSKATGLKLQDFKDGLNIGGATLGNLSVEFPDQDVAQKISANTNYIFGSENPDTGSFMPPAGNQTFSLFYGPTGYNPENPEVGSYEGYGQDVAPDPTYSDASYETSSDYDPTSYGSSNANPTYGQAAYADTPEPSQAATTAAYGEFATDTYSDSGSYSYQQDIWDPEQYASSSASDASAGSSQYDSSNYDFNSSVGSSTSTGSDTSYGDFGGSESE